MSSQSTKKKRIGSRRRATNQNKTSEADEFLETNSISVAQLSIPGENQESVNALSSPDKAPNQSENPPSPELSVNRRKLGSSRRSKGGRHVQDSASVSQQKLREEVEEKSEGNQSSEMTQMPLAEPYEGKDCLIKGQGHEILSKEDIATVYSVKEIQDSKDVSMQDGNLLSNYMVSESKVEPAVEWFSHSQEHVTGESSLEQHGETESNQLRGQFSTSNEPSTKEEQSKMSYLSEEKGYFQSDQVVSTDGEGMEQTPVIWTDDVEKLVHEGQASEISENLFNSTEVSDSTGDSSKTQEVLNLDNKLNDKNVIENSEANNEDHYLCDIEKPLTTGTDRLGSELGEVNEKECRHDENVEPSVEQAFHHPKELAVDLSRSSLQMPQSETASQSDSKIQDDTLTVDEHSSGFSTTGTRKKMGSSRRNKERQQIRNSADELCHKPAQKVVECSVDNEDLVTNVSLLTETLLQGNSIESTLEEMTNFDTFKTENLSQGVDISEGNSSEQHTEAETSDKKAAFPSPEEDLSTVEEQREVFLLSEAKGARQSEDSFVEAREHGEDMLGTEQSSKLLIVNAVENSEIVSDKQINQDKDGDLSQFTKNSTDDFATEQHNLNLYEMQEEHSSVEDKFEALDPSTKDFIERPQREDKELGRSEGKVEDDIELSPEQTDHLEKEMDNIKSFQALKSEEHVSLNSKPLQISNSLNLTAEATHQGPKEEDIELTKDDEALESNEISLPPEDGLVEENLDEMDTFDTAEMREGSDQVQYDADFGTQRDASEETITNVQSSSNINQKLSVESSVSEPDKELYHLFPETTEDKESIEKTTQHLLPDVNEQGNFLGNGSLFNSEERDLAAMLTESHSPKKDTKLECSVGNEEFSSQKKDIHTNEELDDISTCMSKVVGVLHSKEAVKEEYEQEEGIKQTQMQEVHYPSERVTNNDSDNSALLSEHQEEQESGSHQIGLFVKSTNLATELEDLDDSNQKGVLSDNEEHRSSLETLQPHLEDPALHCLNRNEQTHTAFNPIKNHRKLGSSRRYKDRKQDKDSVAELYHEQREDVEITSANEEFEPSKKIPETEKVSCEELYQDSESKFTMPETDSFSLCPDNVPFEDQTPTTSNYHETDIQEKPVAIILDQVDPVDTPWAEEVLDHGEDNAHVGTAVDELPEIGSTTQLQPTSQSIFNDVPEDKLLQMHSVLEKESTEKDEDKDLSRQDGNFQVNNVESVSAFRQELFVEKYQIEEHAENGSIVQAVSTDKEETEHVTVSHVGVGHHSEFSVDEANEDEVKTTQMPEEYQPIHLTSEENNSSGQALWSEMNAPSDSEPQPVKAFGNKRKLGSSRRNRGRQHVKNTVTETLQGPSEEYVEKGSSDEALDLSTEDILLSVEQNKKEQTPTTSNYHETDLENLIPVREIPQEYHHERDSVLKVEKSDKSTIGTCEDNDQAVPQQNEDLRGVQDPSQNQDVKPAPVYQQDTSKNVEVLSGDLTEEDEISNTNQSELTEREHVSPNSQKDLHPHDKHEGHAMNSTNIEGLDQANKELHDIDTGSHETMMEETEPVTVSHVGVGHHSGFSVDEANEDEVKTTQMPEEYQPIHPTSEENNSSGQALWSEMNAPSDSEPQPVKAFGNKRKLGSSRRNRGRQHLKNTVTETLQGPSEEYVEKGSSDEALDLSTEDIVLSVEQNKKEQTPTTSNYHETDLENLIPVREIPQEYHHERDSVLKVEKSDKSTIGTCEDNDQSVPQQNEDLRGVQDPSQNQDVKPAPVNQQDTSKNVEVLSGDLTEEDEISNTNQSELTEREHVPPNSQKDLHPHDKHEGHAMNSTNIEGLDQANKELHDIDTGSHETMMETEGHIEDEIQPLSEKTGHPEEKDLCFEAEKGESLLQTLHLEIHASQSEDQQSDSMQERDPAAKSYQSHTEEDIQEVRENLSADTTELSLREETEIQEKPVDIILDQVDPVDTPWAEEVLKHGEDNAHVGTAVDELPEIGSTTHLQPTSQLTFNDVPEDKLLQMHSVLEKESTEKEEDKDLSRQDGNFQVNNVESVSAVRQELFVEKYQIEEHAENGSIVQAVSTDKEETEHVTVSHVGVGHHSGFSVDEANEDEVKTTQMPEEYQPIHLTSEENNSSGQALWSEMNAPSDSESQPVKAFGNKRKLGSSRRNRGRQHVKNTVTETLQGPTEDFVEKGSSDEALDLSTEDILLSDEKNKKEQTPTTSNYHETDLENLIPVREIPQEYHHERDSVLKVEKSDKSMIGTCEDNDQAVPQQNEDLRGVQDPSQNQDVKPAPVNQQNTSKNVEVLSGDLTEEDEISNTNQSELTEREHVPPNSQKDLHPHDKHEGHAMNSTNIEGLDQANKELHDIDTGSHETMMEETEHVTVSHVGVGHHSEFSVDEANEDEVKTTQMPEEYQPIHPTSEENNSSGQALWSEMNAPSDSEPQPVKAFGNKRKLGSSRRNRGRQHVKNTVTETLQGPTEDFVEKGSSDEALSLSTEDILLSDETNKQDESDHTDLFKFTMGITNSNDNSVRILSQNDEDSGAILSADNSILIKNDLEQAQVTNDPDNLSQHTEYEKTDLIQSPHTSALKDDVDSKNTPSHDDEFVTLSPCDHVEQEDDCYNENKEALTCDKDKDINMQQMNDAEVKSGHVTGDNYNVDVTAEMDVPVSKNDKAHTKNTKDTMASEDITDPEFNKTDSLAPLDSGLMVNFKKEQTGDVDEGSGSENLPEKSKQRKRKLGSSRRLLRLKSPAREQDSKDEIKKVESDAQAEVRNLERVEVMEEFTELATAEFSPNENVKPPLSLAHELLQESGELGRILDSERNLQSNISDQPTSENSVLNTNPPLSSKTEEYPHTGLTDGSTVSPDETTQSLQNEEEFVKATQNQTLTSEEELIVAEADVETVKTVASGGEEQNNTETVIQEPYNLEEEAHFLETENENVILNLPQRRRKMGSSRKNPKNQRKTKEEDLSPQQEEDNEAVEATKKDAEDEHFSGIKEGEPKVSVEQEDRDSELKKAVVSETVEYTLIDKSQLAPTAQSTEENPVPESQTEHQLTPSYLPASHTKTVKLDEMSESASDGRRRKMGSSRKARAQLSGKKHTAREDKISEKEDGGGITEESNIKTAEEQSLAVPESKVDKTNKSALETGDDVTPTSEKTPQLKAPVQQPSAEISLDQEGQKTFSLVDSRLAAVGSNCYNVVMVGNSSVGKTSFMKRAQSGKFSVDLPASIGIDACVWNVVVDGKPVVLKLWDTAGQERFHSITRQILHKAQAFLLMYDITSSHSFSAVSYWASCIQDGAAEDVIVLLLGNKSDDDAKRQVKTQEGETLAKEHNFEFMECSAATGENVIQSLESVARMLSQNADTREEATVLFKEPQKKKSSGCC